MYKIIEIIWWSYTNGSVIANLQLYLTLVCVFSVGRLLAL